MSKDQKLTRCGGARHRLALNGKPYITNDKGPNLQNTGYLDLPFVARGLLILPMIGCGLFGGPRTQSPPFLVLKGAR